jgi:hypothetical protein
MKYLEPWKWLGNNSIDHFLLQHWVKVRNTSLVLYLSIYAVESCCRLEGPNPEECSAIRRRLLLPEEGVVPMCPVTCVIYVHETRHFFAAVFDHQRRHITTLGRNYKVNKTGIDHNPEEWCGPHIWRNMCMIFGWRVPQQQPTWWVVDWTQVNIANKTSIGS